MNRNSVARGSRLGEMERHVPTALDRAPTASRPQGEDLESFRGLAEQVVRQSPPPARPPAVISSAGVSGDSAPMMRGVAMGER